MREATARKPKSKPVPAMRIELMPLTELAEWPGNPKEHDEATLDGSLDRFGYVEVIVLDEGTRRMVVGHGRRERLLERKRRGLEPPERVEVRADGEWLVPVQRGIAFDNEREAEAYLLTSNQSTIAGGYHEKRLAEMLSRHTDNLTGIGWDPHEADALLARTRALLDQPAPVEPEPSKRPSKPPRLRPADVVDSARVIVGDMRSVLAELEADSVDATCSDPPYGLEFMGKRWDQQVPGPEYWREVMRVLKPGAYLVAFGGTRTAHRLACAIEDAGFEVRDCLSWLYGSGFPKSLDVGKAIDRELGAERHRVVRPGVKSGCSPDLNTYGSGLNVGFRQRELRAPATDEAARWDGWGTALKPAWEPIYLCRKPMSGTVASNVREHGVGALNIDETRIGVGKRVPGSPKRADASTHTVSLPGYPGGSGHDANVGRWPANVALDEVAARELDAQSGSTQSSDRPRNNAADQQPTSWGKGANVSSGYTDFGGASRFFYTAKASRAEREAGLEALDDDTDGRLNQHPTVKPVSLMRWLIRMITPPGGLVLDPFCGSGSTGVAAVLEGSRFIGVELNADYAEVARGRIAHYADEDDEADA